MDATFRLTEKFLTSYKERKPAFGFGGLGELVYTRTYSRIKENGANEVWWETCRRVVEGCYRMQERHIKSLNLGWNAWKAQKSAQDMYDRMFTFKFLPPGRGIWAMGTELTEKRGMFAALNNCFSGDTEFLTDTGTMRFEDAVNCTVRVLNGNREYVKVLVQEFGSQPLQEVVLRPKGLRTNHRLRYKATPNHTWVLSSGERTTELRVGDTVRSLVCAGGGFGPETAERGMVHGLVFADGTRHTYYPNRFMIRLCGDKVRHRAILEAHPGYISTHTVDGDLMITLRSDTTDLKVLPAWEDPSYILGFITGWYLMDGHKSPSGTWTVDTQKEEAAEWLIAHAPQAGFTVTGHSLETRATNYGERSAPLHRVTMASGSHDFVVEEIRDLGRSERVYCVTEPETGSFVLAGGILTGNCGFVSTVNIAEEGSKPFCFLMDASMLGIGVGFDVKGEGKLTVKGPAGTGYIHEITDDREGWVESVALLIDSYLFCKPIPMFNYLRIRLKGEPIHGFGGVASGPEPLMELHRHIIRVLTQNIGKPITLTTIVDLMNLIGKCVVAGNVRRTAEIVFGDATSEEYLNLKDHRWNPALNDGKGGWDGTAAERADWSWTSNNSVFCNVGMDYSRCAKQTAKNGEPGYAWLDNMRAYGRMIDGENWRDHRVSGGNPCLEQSLEGYELCCLVETYPNNHETFEDFRKTLKVAYLYAKTVTLGSTHWAETNRVMLRNRRIGTSMSGIQQFIASRSMDEFKNWCELGYEAIQRYDRIYSDWFAVPVSIKTTSVKPSGTVSLLAGATPGMHFPESIHYIRRLTLARNSPLVKPLQDAGYTIEYKQGDDSSLVLEFPVEIDDYNGKLRTVSDVSIWEQVAMAAFLQTYWADNQVSCTVTFDPRFESREIEHVLNHFQYNLKGISFLPKLEHGAFPQMPYEEISPMQYEDMVRDLKPFNLGTVVGEEAEVEKFCNNDSCTL